MEVTYVIDVVPAECGNFLGESYGVLFTWAEPSKRRARLTGRKTRLGDGRCNWGGLLLVLTGGYGQRSEHGQDNTFCVMHRKVQVRVAYDDGGILQVT